MNGGFLFVIGLFVGTVWGSGIMAFLLMRWFQKYLNER